MLEAITAASATAGHALRIDNQR